MLTLLLTPFAAVGIFGSEVIFLPVTRAADTLYTGRSFRGHSNPSTVLLHTETDLHFRTTTTTNPQANAKTKGYEMFSQSLRSMTSHSFFLPSRDSLSSS